VVDEIVRYQAKNALLGEVEDDLGSIIILEFYNDI
jgi:hypothetical protein